jgi:hypothetical protein
MILEVSMTQYQILFHGVAFPGFPLARFRTRLYLPSYYYPPTQIVGPFPAG